jgi:hypothetical protein
MSYRMIDALVTTHIQEVRRQAARHPRVPQPIGDTAGPLRTDAMGSESVSRHPAGLRNRIGFALIEAGLRLSAPPSGRVPSPTPE